MFKAHLPFLPHFSRTNEAQTLLTKSFRPHHTTGKPPCLTMSFGFASWEKKQFSGRRKRKKTKWKKWFVSFHNGGNFVPSVSGHNDGCRKSEQAQRSQNLNQSTLQSTFFFIRYSFPQPRVSSIGFNPWPFFKNIANVASDLNKSKKSAKKKKIFF